MPLPAGTQLGPYEIVGAIGAGGMGEVYQARDTKLNRVVALKTLPPAFAADADRLARFRREAHVLASLNHPNIAAIHGFEDSGSIHALVMEFVPGRTLDALMVAPMPVAEALPIARQIATALEAAHEQGIVHRDLKPANVKLTDDGTVKVLDFGLAKAISSEGTSGVSLQAGAQDRSPSVLTMTSPAMTGMGVILGTAGYMSPEQAKGKPVDRRADIWALGVVIFEMLSGRALYRGETVTETIAHVITQPPDWSLLPPDIPRAVRRILRRCLEKDPRARYQSAGDVRIDIDEALSGSDEVPATTPAPVPAAPAWRRWLPWAMAAGLLVALAFVAWPRPAEPARPARFDVRLTADTQLVIDDNLDGAVAVISPDGQHVAYIGTTDGVRRLHLRPIDRLEATPIADSEGATQPFFSPDSRSIAFFAGGKLKRLPLSGGPAIPVVDVPDSRGGTWGPDNTIVFTPSVTSGLSRVAASGGVPVAVTQLGAGERTHRWPSFLPDGRTVLFMCQLNTGAYDDGTIEAVRLDTGARTVLVRGGTYPLYAAGHLLYTRQNTVYGVRFDPDRLEVLGEAQPVVSGVMSSGGGVGAGTGNGGSQFTVAANGTAMYVPGARSDNPSVRLTVVDRTGRTTYAFPEKRQFRDPRFSPDGKRLAVRMGDGKMEHVYVLEFERGTLTKMTFEGTTSGLPVWSRDGRHLAYFSDRSQKGLDIVVAPSDGSGAARPLTNAGSTIVPHSFSRDDTLIAASRLDPKTNMDVVIVSIADGTVTPFVNTSAIEMLGVFSPDGRWIAYQAAELSGYPEVFLRAYPDGGSRRQVSSGPGIIPAWTKDGRELIYLAPVGGGHDVMAVDVATADGIVTLGKPQRLFTTRVATPQAAVLYDASADGSRFAMLLQDETADAAQRTHVTVVFNFFDEIRRTLAAK